MKKVKLNKKLQLNKKTIANLNNEELNDVKGGFTYDLSGGARCQWSKCETMEEVCCKVAWRETNNVPLLK